MIVCNPILKTLEMEKVWGLLGKDYQFTKLIMSAGKNLNIPLEEHANMREQRNLRETKRTCETKTTP